MNKFALISFLFVGLGLLSSSSTASPALGLLSSAASQVPLGTTVVQSAGVATSGVVNAVLTNPNLVTRQDLLQLTAGNLQLNLSNPITNIQNFVDISINGGDGSVDLTSPVGVLTLPTYTIPICPPFALVYAGPTSCVACHQDCYVVHNLWGGKCGVSPLTGGRTCLCGKNQKDADDREISTSSEQTCGGVANPVGNTEQLAIADTLRTSSIEVQCRSSRTNGTEPETFDSTGCAEDCQKNHGYESGICEYQYPNVYNALYTSTQEKLLYCICTSGGVKSTNGPSSPISSSRSSNSTTTSTAP